VRDGNVRKIVIIGAGGHARDVLDVFEACNARAPQYEVLGFVVETAYFRPDTLVNGYPVLGDFQWLTEHSREVELVCAVGDTALRRRLTEQGLSLGARFCNVVHPSALLTPRVSISEGCVVSAGVIMTSRVRLGRHVHVNLASTLAHDVVVDDYATIAPGVRLSGNVHVGEGANVGTGATVIEKIHVGRWSVVGAGATVVREVPANATVVGCPARVIKERSPGWHLS
jgi:sugar O-acyltransferase (sialic acid O-acetyltransferase NeuD family)